jgi:hypothetical protein
VSGKGWDGVRGGEMTQTLYAHMNKKKKVINLKMPNYACH